MNNNSDLINFFTQLSNPRSSTATQKGSTPTPSSQQQQPQQQQAAGWKGFEDILGRIKGATVDEVQRGSNAEASQARQLLRGNNGGPKTTLVFFLGGVTFAEVAALRFLSEQLGAGRKIVIGTTGVIGGKGAIESVMETGGFGEKSAVAAVAVGGAA